MSALDSVSFEEARSFLPRGPVFSEANMNRGQLRILDEWMEANGARRHIPENSRVVIRGRWLEYDEYPIRRHGRQFRQDAARVPVLQDRNGYDYLPSRRVRLRIRRPLGPWLHDWVRGLV